MRENTFIIRKVSFSLCLLNVMLITQKQLVKLDIVKMSYAYLILYKRYNRSGINTFSHFTYIGGIAYYLYGGCIFPIFFNTAAFCGCVLYSRGGGGCGGGGGAGAGGNRGNFGTGVRTSISKPTTFIYLAFEKTDPFIYLIIQNVDLFIYCPLIFCTHFLLVITQMSQSIHVIPRG